MPKTFEVEGFSAFYGEAVGFFGSLQVISVFIKLHGTLPGWWLNQPL